MTTNQLIREFAKAHGTDNNQSFASLTKAIAFAKAKRAKGHDAWVWMSIDGSPMVTWI